MQSDGYHFLLFVSIDIFPNDRHIQNTRGSSGNWENEEVRRRTRISLAKIEPDDVWVVCLISSCQNPFPEISI